MPERSGVLEAGGTGHAGDYKLYTPSTSRCVIPENRIIVNSELLYPLEAIQLTVLITITGTPCKLCSLIVCDIDSPV